MLAVFGPVTQCRRRVINGPFAHSPYGVWAAGHSFPCLTPGCSNRNSSARSRPSDESRKDSIEDEGTCEKVGEPEPLDARGTPGGPRNRDEDDVTSGEKDATSQRLLSSPEGNIARALGLTNVVVNTTPAQRRHRRPTGLISPSPSRGEIGVKPFRWGCAPLLGFMT